MAEKLIFLSHIHEEQRPAIDIKFALEAEFGGLVDVFVSSEQRDNPAGHNFLQLVEKALATCVGAIYLISPESVKRSWINFELGAVWMRNHVSLQSHGPAIPTIPLCHSGSTPSTLPLPLSVLQAAKANSPSDLEKTFMSLQAAVGGRGNLRTDFVGLAQKIKEFENFYTVGQHLSKIIEIIGVDKASLKRELGSNAGIRVEALVPHHLLGEVQQLARLLTGYVMLQTSHQKSSTTLTAAGPVSVSGTQCSITFVREGLERI